VNRAALTALYIEIVPEVRRNAQGKVLRAALRERLDHPEAVA
jgi:acyl-CoA synthetase (AMP-forming)/AMP-acid ligase II